jgi:serine phosphatase RsbU (regulator of sigma subunit)
LIQKLHFFLQHHQHGSGDGVLVDRLTFWNTFFGDEHEYMVCYSKDHQGFFIAIILLLIVLVGLIFWIVYNAKKNAKYLNQINKHVSEKNQDLIDSITYAKSIQNTIIPKEKEFSELLPNGFVFHEAKDIVSGDFYWVTKKNNRTYVVIVDCTGHGVPGAFLSLIGHQALVRAIHDDGITLPNMILDRMNDYVKKSLRQMEMSGVNDSMDAAIIALDDNPNQLEFSGAKMNLIHVQNQKINVIKGAKLSVGSVESHIKEPPKNEIVNIISGDCFYIHSDGYVDQFGGQQNTKYKTSNLKEFVKKISVLPIQSQKLAFESEFFNWKGDNKQIDDVTIIGIKF